MFDMHVVLLFPCALASLPHCDRDLEAAHEREKRLAHQLASAAAELHVLHSEHHALQAAHAGMVHASGGNGEEAAVRAGGGGGGGENTESALGSVGGPPTALITPDTPSQRARRHSAAISDGLLSSRRSGGVGGGGGAAAGGGRVEPPPLLPVGSASVDDDSNGLTSARGAAGAALCPHGPGGSGGGADAGPDALVQQNRLLRQRVSDLSTTLQSWESTRFAQEQVGLLLWRKWNTQIWTCANGKPAE